MWPHRGVVYRANGFESVSGRDEDLADEARLVLQYLDLPARSGESLELCLTAGEDEERHVLEHAGWSVADAWDMAADLDDYRAYVQRPRGGELREAVVHAPRERVDQRPNPVLSGEWQAGDRPAHGTKHDPARSRRPFPRPRGGG